MQMLHIIWIKKYNMYL